MRLAFIGGFGHHYLRAAVADPACGIDLPIGVAGDGHDDGRSRAMCEHFPETVWYPNPEALLDHFLPHAVSVGSIYGFNGDIAAMALERDIGVVSDKPIAATWPQFHRLQSLLKDHRRVIATEFDFRCRPETIAARKAVADGLLGDVALAVAQKSYRFGTRPAWYADRRSYSGTLMWIASHGIDAIPFITGRRYRRVMGVGGNVSHPELGTFEDHVAAVYQLDNGGSGIVHADILRPEKSATHGDDRMRIVGSRGQIEIRDRRCVLTTNDQQPVDITERGETRPLHVELLEAMQGRSERFGSASSMATAEILLHSRDALDGGRFIDLP